MPSLGSSILLGLAALLPQLGHAQTNSSSSNSSSSDGVSVNWLGSTPSQGSGTTFGLPWARGQHQAEGASFTASADGEDVHLQSWVTAYWPDGSLKWTAHAIAPADATHDEYTVSVSSSNSTVSSAMTPSSDMMVSDEDDMVEVDTGVMSISFPKSGSNVVGQITANGKRVGRNGRLMVSTQTGIDDDYDKLGSADISYSHFESNIMNVTVEESSAVRALVTVHGNHTMRTDANSTSDSSETLFPFVLRFYMYENSEHVKIMHSFTYDASQNTTFLRGMGIRFDVPLLGDEAYDRHIRIAAQEGGFLSESPLGITGLRRDPGEEVRDAQVAGRKTPPLAEWDERVTTRFQWIPRWNDYRLDQLSPDGFTLKKRTQSGQSWVKIPGGTRAGGLAYLGGATGGGLAVGLRDFWQQYPVSLDVSNSAEDTGEITLWLHSPSAPPMDLRPYHDSLGQDTFEEQLDALDITYEDYQPGWDTPFGIAKTHEIHLYGFNSTPSADTLSDLEGVMNDPPVLASSPEYISSTEALGTYWAPPQNGSAASEEIEAHLNLLVDFYIQQVEDQRWYGFWDFGDIMHTYDEDRHIWRYDIGGYAWDNGELSPELFFWQQFLRTGRKDLYRFAERLSRHGGDTDVYHAGPFKFFGTRHGVQHFSDSSKQIRVSTPQYRKPLYFVSGGDERIGELLAEQMDADATYLNVDVQRKVREADFTYNPDPEALLIGLGTDWSGLAAGWLVEWERRGPRYEEARQKLTNTMTGIANLTNGFVTGNALYNSTDGALSPPPDDANNTGLVSVSHLSAVFGQPEVIAEIEAHMADAYPAAFDRVWLDYCVFYNAPASEQETRYGEDFGSTTLEQGHSRLTAYAAWRLGNATLASRAWAEFYVNEDGIVPSAPWEVVELDGSQVLRPVEEAAWVSTNAASQYGLAAVQNMRFVGPAPAVPKEEEEEDDDGGS